MRRRRRGHLRLSVISVHEARRAGLAFGAGLAVSKVWWMILKRVSRLRKDGSMGCIFGGLISSRGRGAFGVCFCPF